MNAGTILEIIENIGTVERLIVAVKAAYAQPGSTVVKLEDAVMAILPVLESGLLKPFLSPKTEAAVESSAAAVSTVVAAVKPMAEVPAPAAPPPPVTPADLAKPVDALVHDMAQDSFSQPSE